jgi:protease I
MMQERKLEGLRVAIVVNTDFEQVELTEPKKALEEAGARTTIISAKPGEITGMRHDVKADTFKVDMTLDEANPDDFDAVLIPGGALNADSLRVVTKAQEFVKKIDETGKPIAVICHGPWLLVNAGLLKGRKLTSWPTIELDLRNAGATWVNQEVVRDRKWVSSRGPQDLKAFNEELLKLFEESKSGLRQPTTAATKGFR